MARIPIDIGELTFSTKTAAKDYFRQMLYRYDVGVRIGERDATELSWLLLRHPEFKDKIGVGVSSFSVRNALYGTRCFEVNRSDGSTTDFSFQSCVDGAAPSALQQAIEAMRAEVTEDILEKKRAWFREHGNSEGKVPCAITDARISIEEAHADHAPPRTFGTLAALFLEARGIDPSANFFTPPADNQYQPRMVDQNLAAAWRDYHHRLAIIRVVARNANLARAHEGKVKTKDRQLQLK